MPQTKIVFFDIDGTLIDMQAKKITPKMLETLHRLQDRGIKICIATGRSPMVLPKIDGVAFDAYLTFNGSLCYDRKGVIFSNPIPHKDVVRFIQNAAALGRPVCVSTRDRLAANGADTDLTDYFFIANEPVPVADDFDAVCAEDIYQLMLGCRPKDYPALLDTLARRQDVYNETTAAIREKERRGEVFVIRPEAPLDIKRVDHNRARIQAVYDLGRAVAEKRLAAMRTFLEERGNQP